MPLQKSIVLLADVPQPPHEGLEAVTMTWRRTDSHEGHYVDFILFCVRSQGKLVIIVPHVLTDLNSVNGRGARLYWSLALRVRTMSCCQPTVCTVVQGADSRPDS
jgi:hypothetical protein